MAILTPSQAKKYYDEILEIHFNRGSQSLPRRVVEYQFFLDEILFNIEIVDKKTNTLIKGGDFLYKERRSIENKDGTVSPALWADILFLRGYRNDKSHNANATIDNNRYRVCLMAVAQTIEYFSEVPIPQEIIEVYNTGNLSTPSQNAPPKPSENKLKPATPSTPSQNASPEPSGTTPKPVEAIPEGLWYENYIKGVKISGYTGNSATLIIPSIIEKKK